MSKTAKSENRMWGTKGAGVHPMMAEHSKTVGFVRGNNGPGLTKRGQKGEISPGSYRIGVFSHRNGPGSDYIYIDRGSLSPMAGTP